MKRFSLLVIALSIFIIGTACQKQKAEQSTYLPTAVNELQAQTVPEVEKLSINKKTLEEPIKSDVLLYNGYWFDIKYPKGFTATPVDGKTDEARFLSMDGAVEFFVFSPLWGGDPVDYLKVSPTEEMVDEKTEKNTRWVTLKAKDGSYYRSYVSMKSQVNTGSDLHKVFGIKYITAEAYQEYKDAYISFKESLQQYAD